MKKLIITLIIGLALVAPISVARASTIEELQIQYRSLLTQLISLLMQEVEQLQIQLAQMNATVSPQVNLQPSSQGNSSTSSLNETANTGGTTVETPPVVVPPTTTSPSTESVAPVPSCTLTAVNVFNGDNNYSVTVSWTSQSGMGFLYGSVGHAGGDPVVENYQRFGYLNSVEGTLSNVFFSNSYKAVFGDTVCYASL